MWYGLNVWAQATSWQICGEQWVHSGAFWDDVPLKVNGGCVPHTNCNKIWQQCCRFLDRFEILPHFAAYTPGKKRYQFWTKQSLALKVKNDHRSKFSRLSNSKETSEKIFLRYEFNKLTLLPKCSVIAQLVEHRTGIRGGHGFESRWSPDFFQASSLQLLKLENLLRWSFFTDHWTDQANI